MLEANGISQAVLVQPSFLGTDNSYMLAALRQWPTRFRGIAVVSPEVSGEELRELSGAGVVGVRLNLIGAADPPLTSELWKSFLARVAELNWQVEVHAEARRWPALIGPLLEGGVTVVADHFGRPDPALGVDDPGFRYLLAQGGTGRVWVKLSGAYRNGDNGAGDRIAVAAIPLLKQSLGLNHLVWGSDWPHTQYERVADYGALLSQLRAWLPSPEDRKTVLVELALPAVSFPIDASTPDVASSLSSIGRQPCGSSAKP